MKVIRNTCFILSFFLLACGDSTDKTDESTELTQNDTIDYSSSQKNEAPLSSSDKKSVSSRPKKNITKAELENIIEDTGFRLEEMKGQLSITEQSLEKYKKKKKTVENAKEIELLEKETSELKRSIEKTLLKLELQQNQLKKFK